MSFIVFSDSSHFDRVKEHVNNSFSDSYCLNGLNVNSAYFYIYLFQDKPEVGVCGYSGRKFIQKQFYDPAQHGESITYEEYLEQMRPKPRE